MLIRQVLELVQMNLEKQLHEKHYQTQQVNRDEDVLEKFLELQVWFLNEVRR